MKFMDALNEIARAQSPADKEFVALHPVEKKEIVKYPEHQFKGGTGVKKDKSKLTHSSNATGMVDDIAKEKPVAEDFDAIAECVLTEKKDREAAMDEKNKKRAEKVRDQMRQKARVAKRTLTIEEIEEIFTEEFGQLDEISKRTLGSYVEKSAVNHGTHMYLHGVKSQRSNDTSVNHDDRVKERESASKHYDKAIKRSLGIKQATKKLTKEEMDEMSFEDLVEHNLQEISKATLGSYMQKASSDIVNRYEIGSYKEEPTPKAGQSEKIEKRKAGVVRAWQKTLK